MKYIAFLFLLLTQVCNAQEYDRIILIVADDLGARDLGCYGNSFIETPRLDALAEAGAKVNNAYASGPICSPTRASILTGLSPARLGMTEHLRGEPPVLPSQRLIPPKNITHIPKDIPTIAKMFKNKEFSTAIVGKWHLGGGDQNPDNYGYDLTYASSWPGLPPSYFYPFWNAGVFPELEEDGEDGDYLTDILGDRAVKYIQDNEEENYFLHVNFYSPHVPIMARPDLLAKYDSIRAENPSMEFPNVHYAAMVEAIDENVGKMLDALENLGQLENTLVVFTSDHGGLDVEEVPAFALHTPPTDNGELRGGKGYLYEGGIRVPWIMSHNLLEGMDEPPVASADLFNIFAELIGSEERTPDGADLTKLGSYTDNNPRALHWHFPHYSPQKGRPESAIIKGNYKLIRHYEGSFDELFSLEDGEIVNLANIDLEKKEELTKALDEWLLEVDASKIEDNPNYFPVAQSFHESFNADNELLETYDEGEGFYSRWNKLTDGESAVIVKEDSGQCLLVQNPSAEEVEYGRRLDRPYDLRGDQSYWFLVERKSSDEEGEVSISLNDKEGARLLSIELSNLAEEQQVTLGMQQSEFSFAGDSLVFKVQVMADGADTLHMWTVDASQAFVRSANHVFTTELPSDLSFVEDLKLGLKGAGGFRLLKGGRSPSDVLDNFIQPAFTSLVETFNYEAGLRLTGQGTNQNGWAGPWLLQNELQDNLSGVGSGSIMIENDLVTSGNKYDVEYNSPGSRVRLDRMLAGKIVSDGSTYWISYISQVGEGNAPNNVSNLSLINSNETGEQGMILSVGRLYGNRKLGLSTPADGQRKDVNKFDIGTHWIVCKIRTYDDDRPDDYFMWVDPGSVAEPSESEADVTLSSSVLQNPADGVRIRTEGAGGNQTPLTKSYDEIKISKDWSSVVTSVQEIIPELGIISVFPNPVSDALTLEIDLVKSSLLKSSLLSIDGDTVQTFRVTRVPEGNNKITYDVNSALTGGYYFLHLRFDDRSFIRKIIIIK